MQPLDLVSLWQSRMMLNIAGPTALPAEIQANTFTISEATFQIYSPNTPCNKPILQLAMVGDTVGSSVSVLLIE
jgi:hypothetical protein